MSHFNAAESKAGIGRGPASSKSSTNLHPPPSPRRSWMKIGRARSSENMHPLADQRHPSPRSKSPPLTLATGSPGVADGNKIPMSPFDTPPKKLWESGFKSFLSRRSQQPPNAAAFPEVPLMVPTQHQKQRQTDSQKQETGKTAKGESGSNDQCVRGGKIFQSIFGGSGHAQRKERRKAKSMNELDEPMRNGKDKNCSPDAAEYRRVQSQANVVVCNEAGAVKQDDLSQTMRRASHTGTSGGAIVPLPLNQPHHLHQARFIRHNNNNNHPQQVHHMQHNRPLSQPHDALISHLATDYLQYQSQVDLEYRPPPPSYPPNPQYPQSHHTPGLPIQNSLRSPVPSGASSHSISPSSATTEIKKAFTEFHNSSRYARDSTSAYLGDEPSTRRGDAHESIFNPALVVQKKFSTGPQFRPYSHGSIDSGSGHRFLSSSLPPVAEDVNIQKSMRMLRPFQMVDSWQSGRRYLIGPATLATCPLIQGISSLSLSASYNARTGETKESEDQSNAEIGEKIQEGEVSTSIASPAHLPPLFGCIVLGKAQLSYVVQEPLNHQQRWWSSCLLILRQNYLLEYDEQSADVVRGLPRGYAHLQYSKSYAHSDFADALELEFFVSPCAKADKRVLTIRLQGAREKRDNWIACLNRAAQIGIKDLYDYDESGEVGRGRYATVFPARRRTQGKEQDTSVTAQTQHSAPKDEYDCALKVIDKKEFWKRVVKGRERADTLVRETSVQATLTTKCSKIPAFVRLRSFLELSDTVVLELELLEGMDLFQYVSSKGVLSEKEAAHILRDILTVLDALSRVGVAHRDVKPANCLMCKIDNDNSFDKAPCVVKVADFGMATFVGVDGLVRGRCGTPGYVAPEIFSAGLHGGYGNKVDVFSAGVTLYVMLCGYEPFYGESDEELVAANREAKLDFPLNDWRKVSSEAKDLVKRMMEPDPRRRFSAREALGHRWILEHAGITDSIDVLGRSGVDSLSHSLHKRAESCSIS